MRLPPEDILQFIEANRNISISRDSFLSAEYYNAHHPEGKHHPAFYSNNGDGSGKQTILVELAGIIYVVDRTGKASPDPVKILRSGREGR